MRVPAPAPCTLNPTSISGFEPSALTANNSPVSAGVSRDPNFCAIEMSTRSGLTQRNDDMYVFRPNPNLAVTALPGRRMTTRTVLSSNGTVAAR